MISFTKGKRLEIGDFLPSELACEEHPWKSPSPRRRFSQAGRGEGGSWVERFCVQRSTAKICFTICLSAGPPSCPCGDALEVF